MNQIDVALVSMPFASYKQPALGLSLLEASLWKRSRSARVFYFTIRMAEEIGDWLYDKIATWHITDLLGDWMFAEALFGADIAEPSSYVRDVLEGLVPAHDVKHFGKEPLSDTLVEEILDLRAKTQAFLARCEGELLRAHPRVVGFTSVFHQQLASLALAERVKRSLPGVFVVMGGPNCRGEMGLEIMRQFSFIDAVVPGEGEIVFPQLVEKVCCGETVRHLPGVFHREGPAPGPADRGSTPALRPSSTAPCVVDLNELPYPAYEDFVQQWRQSGAGKGQSRLLFETSRGCWWGQRSRCVFCGQASQDLTYRKKSISRAAQELSFLTATFPDFSICVTDEVVDRKMLTGLARTMISTESYPDVLYLQVRPDLSKEELKLIRRAGVRRLETGVESLSTRVLGLMRKGTTALASIAFLRCCRETGITPVWNLLWGFPGESPDAYEAMTRLVPLLVHLEPPNYVGPFRLDRFSPYFEHPGDFGLEDLRPYPSYRYVYPFPPQTLRNLACYFTFRYREQQEVDSYTGELAEAVALWKEVHPKSHLDAVDHGDRLLISDGRGEEETVFQLTGVERFLYLECSTPRSIEELKAELEQSGFEHAYSDVPQVLLPLIDLGLMLREGSFYLSLAVCR